MVTIYESAKPSPPRCETFGAGGTAYEVGDDRPLRELLEQRPFEQRPLEQRPFEQWRSTQVWADLHTSFEHFDTADIEHLLANRDRLVSNTYDDHQGNHCLFGWLSALHTEPIDCRTALTRYFTGSSGYPACEEPVYQAPRWLVR